MIYQYFNFFELKHCKWKIWSYPGELKQLSLKNTHMWNTNNISLSCNIFSKSYKRYCSLIDDTYANYSQYRTLHQSFYTDENLTKMGI